SSHATEGIVALLRLGLGREILLQGHYFLAFRQPFEHFGLHAVAQADPHFVHEGDPTRGGGGQINLPGLHAQSVRYLLGVSVAFSSAPPPPAFAVSPTPAG